MKRIGNLFNKIISYENLVRAEKKARLGKTKRYGVKKFDRNPDDIVILHPDKDYLRYCLQKIEEYLADNLKLKVKRNWQIFPVEARGIDFIGYVFYHGHTLLRKDIKKKFIYKLGYKSKNKRLTSLAAYWGWCKYGNCHNLWYRFTRSYNFKDYRQKLLSSYGIKESTR